MLFLHRYTFQEPRAYDTPLRGSGWTLQTGITFGKLKTVWRLRTGPGISLSVTLQAVTPSDTTCPGCHIGVTRKE